MMYITVAISSAQFHRGEYYIYIHKDYNVAGWCSSFDIIFNGAIGYKHKRSAIRAAKKIAEKLGLKYQERGL